MLKFNTIVLLLNLFLVVTFRRIHFSSTLPFACVRDEADFRRIWTGGRRELLTITLTVESSDVPEFGKRVICRAALTCIE